MNAVRARLFIAASVAALLAVAGAALAIAAGGEPADDIFEVTMRDGALELESQTLEPGRLVVEAANDGSEEHELVIIRTAKAPDGLPVGLHGVSISLSGELVLGEDHIALGHKHKAGQVLGILPGQSRRTQVDLAPGHYVVYCQTGSHYLGAERTEFTVE